MNPSDPLAQLKDIHLPDAVSWWPLAIGWWIVAIIAIVGIYYAVQFGLNQFFNQRYRRQALAALKNLPNSDQHQAIDYLAANAHIPLAHTGRNIHGKQ